MANRFVIIDNSYSTDGTGTSFSPFTWNQFLTELSGGGSEGLANNNDYFLSGTRSLSANLTIVISATGIINLYSWFENIPAKIVSTNDIYFDQYCPNIGLYDLMLQAVMSGTSNNLFDDGFRTPTQDYGNVYIDNCYLRLGTNARFANLQSFNVRNSTIIATNLQGSCSTINGMSASFVNNIFDISNFDAIPLNNVGTVEVDNCAFTSAITSFSQDTSTWTNIHSQWTRPNVFSSSITAVNITNDLKYTNSAFSLISATGDTSYTRTWLSGTRDGIGALYFPEISGVSISASSASAPLDYSLNFVISGNNPFTVFSASSATYYWDDEPLTTSSVNNNDVITHSFSENASYQVYAVIKSFNEWYNVTATSWTVLVGNFNVTIVIYDQKGNNITGGLTKPLNNLTFSAIVNGLDAGSYSWDLDDEYVETSNPSIQSYISEGLKQIRLSAYSLDDETVSAIDTSTVNISAISDEYFVNIFSAYDVCANNAGTEEDPFNWSEFKGRVETSGEYLDVYRLSGSRVLIGTTNNRNLLIVDRTKNFTIRDWDVSNYGPWVIQAKDFSNSNNNSILSAAGCTLRNGIIYNRPYTSIPGYGGQIVIGTTYDMFIVYQGTYSRIVIDPYQNNLFGSSIMTGTSAVTVWSATTSGNYCSSPDWVYMNTFIEEDFKCSACSSACIDSWWEDIENYKFVGPVTYNGYYGCVMYDTPQRYFSLSAVSGDFDLEWVVAFSATGGNDSVHIRVQSKSTSSTQQDFEYYNSMNFNGINRSVSLQAERAMKMRLIRQGTGTNNTSAYYWHYSPITCANAGDVIGDWNYLNRGTVSGAVIFRADAGDNGVGFGTLKFQADDGFPYVPNVTSGNTIIPSWVSASSGANFNLSNGYSVFSWIIDDFETSSFDCWWSSQFTDSYQISSVSESLVAIANSKDDNKPFRLLSRSGTSLSGDFVIETSVFRRGTEGDLASNIQGISIFATSANINNFGTYNSTSGCVGRMGVRINANTIQGSWNDLGLSALSNSISASIIGLKFERRDGSISAFYKDGELDWQIAPYFNTPIGYLNYSDDVYVVVEGNGYEGFDYFKIAAENGLPNNFFSTTSSVPVVTGTGYSIIASASSKIIGSTIYLSAENVSAWKDNFNENDYNYEDINTLEDIDGNIYDVIKIGNQSWTVQNFRATKYNDGSLMNNVTDNTEWANLTSGAYSFYDNSTDPVQQEKFGALYNWEAVNTGKLAPAGWRVPTDADWTTLSTYLGGEGVAGGKMKTTGTDDWTTPNTGATNESGFSALPGGYRDNVGIFGFSADEGDWWSTTEYDDALGAWSRSLYFYYEYLFRYGSNKKFGFSVRLVKDIDTYNLEITDSVMVNFIRNTSADFSACNAIINNSTFNNTSAAISGNFI